MRPEGEQREGTNPSGLTIRARNPSYGETKITRKIVVEKLYLSHAHRASAPAKEKSKEVIRRVRRNDREVNVVVDGGRTSSPSPKITNLG